ncbi:hypothetical protein CHELA40_11425 [Chelatococcus asaccharovorans]|nr:hypothetical protein CHELA40_11425 [Chelatococcus asaccharovorans]CAH1684793.1 hypothetical protein CHELA17_64178 [Chelatococcus asaccharovorans]
MTSPNARLPIIAWLLATAANRNLFARRNDTILRVREREMLWWMIIAISCLFAAEGVIARK